MTDPVALLPIILNQEKIIPGECNNFNYSQINQTDIEKILKYSEKNGLKFLLLTILKNRDFNNQCIHSFIESEFNLESVKAEKYIETLHFLSGISKRYNLPYILVKSFDSTKHIPNDVDIFIKNEDRLRLIGQLSQNEMNCQQSSIAETKLEGKYMNIDLYTRINYLGIDFVENNLLWNSVKYKQFSSELYPGLNPEADLLMLIPHSLFGHRRMTFLDFLHFMTLKQQVNMDICREYANTRGWGFIFDTFIEVQDSLEKEILINKTALKFPYHYPKKILMAAISHTNVIHFSLKNKVFFTLSYWAEGIVYSLEDSWIYTILKSNKMIHNSFNSMCSFFKKCRGDMKSFN